MLFHWTTICDGDLYWPLEQVDFRANRFFASCQWMTMTMAKAMVKMIHNGRVNDAAVADVSNFCYCSLFVPHYGLSSMAVAEWVFAGQ